MQGCRPLTEDEIEDCIKSFGGKYEKRDRALFVMGIYTGFRISELLSLKVKDVYQHGRIVDRLSVSRHSMKGQYASRSVPIHHHAQLVVNEWVQQMPRFYDVTPETYLICSREGENKPLSRVHAHRILKQIFDSCQMTGTLGTHSMRKTFARRVHINLGGDLAKTRKAVVCKRDMEISP